MSVLARTRRAGQLKPFGERFTSGRRAAKPSSSRLDVDQVTARALSEISRAPVAQQICWGSTRDGELSGDHPRRSSCRNVARHGRFRSGFTAFSAKSACSRSSLRTASAVMAHSRYAAGRPATRRSTAGLRQPGHRMPEVRCAGTRQRRRFRLQLTSPDRCRRSAAGSTATVMNCARKPEHRSISASRRNRGKESRTSSSLIVRY